MAAPNPAFDWYKYPKFAGEDEAQNVDVWLAMYRATTQQQGMNEQQAIANFAAVCEPNAYGKLQDRGFLAAATWQAFQDNAVSVFRSHASAAVTEQRFYLLAQEASEPIKAFAARFAHLNARRTPAQALDQQVAVFRLKILPALREAIKATPNMLFTPLVDLLDSIEGETMPHAVPSQRTAEVAEIRPQQRFSHRPRGSGRPPSTRSRNTTSSSTSTCYKCGGTGHWDSRDRPCPTPDANALPTWRGRRSGISVIATTPQYYSITQLSPHISPAPTLQLPCRVQGRRVHATCDTCAEVAIMPLRTARRLRLTISTRTRITLRAFDGTLSRTLGAVYPTVAAGSRTVCHTEVHVVPELAHDFILSLSLMGSLGVRIDTANVAASVLTLEACQTTTACSPPAPQSISAPDSLTPAPAKQHFSDDAPPRPVPVADPSAPSAASTGWSSATFGKAWRAAKVDATKLISSNADLFVADDSHYGLAHSVPPIILSPNDDTPWHEHQYPLSHQQEGWVNEWVEELQRAGVIRDSSSQFINSLVVAGKATKPFYRICINPRTLNSRLPAPTYPMRINAQEIEALHGSTIFSKIDLSKAFMQMEVDESSRQYLSFLHPRGHSEFCRLPWGCAPASAALQAAMDKVLAGATNVVGAHDDYLVHSRTPSEHLAHLADFFNRLRRSGFLMSGSKCIFGVSELSFLGRWITPSGSRAHPDDLQLLTDWPEPTTQRQLQRFLGFGRWIAYYLPKYDALAAPLHAIAQQHPLPWTEQHAAAFRAITALASDALQLAFPDWTSPFAIEVDASHAAFGACLSQSRNGQRAVIRLAHHKTTNLEEHLPATLLELAALHWAVTKFHRYVSGRLFTVHTDHRALLWLRSMHWPKGRVAEWQADLANYNFEVVHRPGSDQHISDAISRRDTAPAVCAVATADPGISTHEWTTQQQSDPDCIDVTERIANQNRVALDGWAVSPEGILCAVKYIHGIPRFRPVVPATLRERVMRACHQFAGHLRAPTLEALSKSYDWPTLKPDARTFIDACADCQQTVTPRGRRNIARGAVVAVSPLELVAVDLISGFPSDDGMNYIMTIIDIATDYIALAALPNKAASTVAAAFREHWLNQFPQTRKVLSDQGAEFTAEFSALLRNSGIQRTSTTPYHPQSNGKCERANQTVINIIRRMTTDPSKWVHLLPQVAIAFNSAQHGNAMATPNFLMLGHDLLPTTPAAQPTPTAQHLAEQKSQHAKALSKMRVLAHKRKTDAQQPAAASTKPLEFKCGDLVMYKNPAIRQAPLSKLERDWLGPCRILSVRSRHNYTIRQVNQPTRGRSLFIGTVHVKNLKMYHPSPAESPISSAPSTAQRTQSSHSPAPEPVTRMQAHHAPSIVAPPPSPVRAQLPPSELHLSPAPSFKRPAPSPPSPRRPTQPLLPPPSPRRAHPLQTQQLLHPELPTPPANIPHAPTPTSASRVTRAAHIATRTSTRANAGRPPQRLGFEQPSTNPLLHANTPATHMPPM